MLRRAQAEADASQRGMSQGKCITRRINKQFHRRRVTGGTYKWLT